MAYELDREREGEADQFEELLCRAAVSLLCFWMSSSIFVAHYNMSQECVQLRLP